MKRAHINRKCSSPIVLVSILALTLILIVTFYRRKPPNRSFLPYVDSEFTPLPELPRFAYFISGTAGDGTRLKRLLQALYHPRNFYLLHFDFEASETERLELAKYAKSESVFRGFRNVKVMGKGHLVTSKGPTAMALILHAVAVLSKLDMQWDWFVNLGSLDYPLMPQDDILHIFSYLPRGLNFIEHTSDFGWKEHQRARPIIIDPGLYHLKKSGVFWAKEKRSLPAAFKLFTGSPRMVLSRPFLEFCLWGWDNLPRTLLMYYTNFLLSQEGFFHTVACNHKDYQNTTVNHDLHYAKWDNPPKEQPANLTLEDFDNMVVSGAPFAHKVADTDGVLDKIDRELLKRTTNGGPFMVRDGSVESIMPSLSSKRLEKLLFQLLDPVNFRSRQCK